MKKAATLIIFLLIYPALYVSASYIEVTFFSFNPEEPQPGESVALNIRLANKNYDQDFDVTCRLFIDSEIHDVKVVPVTRRSSSGVTFTWTAEPGNHLFSLEMSYYVDRNEETDTFFKNLDVPGGEEEIDYFSEAVRLFDSQSYVQAKSFSSRQSAGLKKLRTWIRHSPVRSISVSVMTTLKQTRNFSKLQKRAAREICTLLLPCISRHKSRTKP